MVVLFLIFFCFLSGDGVWDEISDDHAVSLVQSTLAKTGSVFSAATTLRDAAYLMGSDDNISVIVVSLAKQQHKTSSTHHS